MHGTTVVGEVSGSTWAITMDQNTISSNWSAFLSENGTSIFFTQFGIVKDETNQYTLIGTTKIKTMTAGIRLVEDEGNLYEFLTAAGTGSTCVCTGCNIACNPLHLSGNSWACTPDCETPPGCIKTVTATTGGQIL